MATTRFVHASKGVTTGQFDTPAKAALTVGAALRAAADGDTIVILDGATYLEDELIIDKALTLTSAFLQSHPKADPSDPKFDARPLPTLAPKGGARHRVLRVAGTPDKKPGPVVVSGVRVTQGHAVHRPGSPDPAYGAGGGIAVIDTDDVRIERCVVTGCQTESAPFGAWSEKDRLELRKDLVDLVDALISPATVTALNAAIGTANVLISALPAVGGVKVPAIPLIDLAKIKKLIEGEFDAHLPPGHPIMWLAGQAFGGGIATVWSSATIRNCRIQGNHAEGRGSGLAVVGYGWPTVENCLIDDNGSGAKGRLDGGGIGGEISLPGKLPRDLSELELIKFLRSKVKEAGAKLASPAALPGPIELMQFARWFIDPTQPAVITDNVKRLYLFLLNGHNDPEQLFKHLFYMFASTALALGRWDAWKEPEIKAARTRSVTVRNSKIIGNRCGDGGGGIYCSVLSRISLTDCRVERNTAPGEGGGIRLTMGSAGAVAGCVIDRNVCGTGPDAMSKPKPGKPSVRIATPGGGGISARNVDLTLTGTVIGATSGSAGGGAGGGAARRKGSAGPTGPTGNLTSDHPGGGLLVYADTEGDMGGVPDMWTSILHEVFEVKAIRVAIDGACKISGNGAGFRPGGVPIGKPLFAKGGGVFILRGTFPDRPSIDVTIAGVAKTVSGNIAQLRSYTSRVVPGLVIAAANEICIQDLKDGKEWTETNNASLISKGTLSWP